MTRFLAICLAFLCIAPIARAQVIDYDAPPLTIDGVQLLRDANDPLVYYYLPQYPHLSTNDAGDFELLMMNIVRGSDASDAANNFGGIFHALIEFTLPQNVADGLVEKLAEQVPGAVLAGALPLLEPREDEAATLGSFRVTSATLSSDEDTPNGRVLKSGPAPLRGGAKAAIAARLTTEEAIVLRESLTGTTSDLSVSIRGFYEARVEGYNAVVTANSSTIYEHESFVDSVQSGFTKRQVRDIVDELQQDNAISIEVFDRSEGLAIDADDLDKILDIVTDKLIELTFDTTTGWSQTPPPEVAVAEGQIKDRLEQGWLQKTFMNAEDRPYYTDDQYVIKNVENRREFSFRLDLSRSTTIRVPFDSTGNLGGFYDSITPEQRERHFRVIVPEEDSVTERREVIFQVDSQIADGFADNFNSVSVNVRHAGVDGDLRTEALVFTPDVLNTTNGLLDLELFRAGNLDPEWGEFSYQTAWNLRGTDTILRAPSHEEDWISSNDGIVALSPPLDRSEIEIEVDTSNFDEAEIFAVEIQLATTLMGTVQFVSDNRFRTSNVDPSISTIVWSDPGEDIAWRAVWHTRQGRVTSNFQLLDGAFLLVFAPDPEWLEERLQ